MAGKKASDYAAAPEQILAETCQGRNHHIMSVRRRGVVGRSSGGKPVGAQRRGLGEGWKPSL
jgi:hypothetical protein